MRISGGQLRSPVSTEHSTPSISMTMRHATPISTSLDTRVMHSRPTRPLTTHSKHSSLQESNTSGQIVEVNLRERSLKPTYTSVEPSTSSPFTTLMSKLE